VDAEELPVTVTHVDGWRDPVAEQHRATGIGHPDLGHLDSQFSCDDSIATRSALRPKLP